jgi:hypothetical protein
LKASSFLGRKAAVVVSAIATLGVAGLLSAIPASAGTGTVGVLYANGSSTAVLNSSGAPVLTAGATPATDSAQIDLLNVSGTQAPTTAPTFVSSPAPTGGDPRWVIEFHNGCYLFGQNPATGSGGLTWYLEPSGTLEASYSAALTAAQACGGDDTVTAAFIVTDAGEPGVAFTLTDITYNGTVTVEASTPAPTPSKSSSSKSSSAPTVPTGGVETGGGNPASTPWGPFGLGLAGLGALLVVGGAAIRARSRKSQG